MRICRLRGENVGTASVPEGDDQLAAGAAQLGPKGDAQGRAEIDWVVRRMLQLSIEVGATRRARTPHVTGPHAVTPRRKHIVGHGVTTRAPRNAVAGRSGEP